MIAHDAFRRLSSASVDFPLAATEQDALDTHLAGCAECRAYQSRLRADAAGLRAIAFAEPPPRVRTAVLAAARHPTHQLATWRLLIAAALLLAAVGGAVLVVGALIRLRVDAPDAIAWHPVAAELLSTPDASVRVTAVAGGRAASGVRFVAGVSSAGADFILVSDDGRTWSRAPGPAIDGVPMQVSAVEFLAGAGVEGAFVAAGTTGDQAVVATSRDGRSWTVERLPGSGTPLAIGARGPTIVVVGSAGEGPMFWSRSPGDGWRSGTWTTDGNLPDPPPSALIDTGDAMLAVASGQAYRSEDGLSWAEQVNDLGVIGKLSLARRGDTILAVGDVRGRPGVWRSRDGIAWSPSVLPGPPASPATPVGIVDQGGYWIVVGNGPAGATAWVSRDGAAWDVGSAISGGAGARLVDVALAGDTIVAVGMRGSAGAVWYGTEERP